MHGGMILVSARLWFPAESFFSSLSSPLHKGFPLPRPRPRARARSRSRMRTTEYLLSIEIWGKYLPRYSHGNIYPDIPYNPILPIKKKLKLYLRLSIMERANSTKKSDLGAKIKVPGQYIIYCPETRAIYNIFSSRACPHMRAIYDVIPLLSGIYGIWGKDNKA